MRFLEKMVSEMLRESTGIDARRAVRMIGGRRMAKMGLGAVAIGGLAHLLEKHGSVGAAQPGSPTTGGSSPVPPLPPLPGSPPAQAVPNLPPIPSSGPPPVPPPPPEEEPEEPAYLVRAILRVMAAAAAADGELAECEREVLERHRKDPELDDAAREQLDRDLASPPSPGEIAASVEGDADRETVFRYAVLMMNADDEIAPRERAWLGRLGEALGLDPVRQAELEGELLADVGVA